MKFILLIVVMVTLQTQAQQNPIASITISLPPNPDAKIANWATGGSMLTISAMAKAVNGRVDPRLESARVLVLIKKSGTKACGNNTASMAPMAGFSSLTKVWSGANAIGLLGEECTLAPGEYELSVQIFGPGPAGSQPLSEEKIKLFSIKETNTETYQPPQPILPANGTVISETEIKKPVTFRWTPVIPKPPDNVTYRLSVWRIMDGQNSIQATIIQPPILGNDVGQYSHVIIPSQLSPRPNTQEAYVWNVQALNRDGKPIGTNNGTSEPFIITIQPVNDPPVMVNLVSPAKGAKIPADQLTEFRWALRTGNNYSSGSNQLYKIKIVELKENELPAHAMRGNKPFFERDSIRPLSLTYPANAPAFKQGKRYAWQVEVKAENGVKITESEINEFVANSKSRGLKLITPANGAVIDGNPQFSWTFDPTPGDYDGDGYFKIKIVEIKGDESPEQAFKGNKPFFEKDSLRPLSFQYPSSAPEPEQVKRYAWIIESKKEGIKITESEINEFVMAPAKESNLVLLAPANKAAIEAGGIINFTWIPPTPVTPELSYKIKIVEIKGDQSPENAMRGNKPFFERDSLIRPSFEYSSSFPALKAGTRYAWSVQALNRDGKQIGGENVHSFDLLENTTKEFICCKSIDPHDGIKFSWLSNSKGPFGIKIVEVSPGQSPGEAILKNKVVFEKDGIKGTMFMWPVGYKGLKKDTKYAWLVEIKKDGVKITESGIDEFILPALKENRVSVVTPENNAMIEAKQTITFTWKAPVSAPSNTTYKIKIAEITGDQSPEVALRTNKPHFEKDSIRPLSFKYPATLLAAGKRYAWVIEAKKEGAKIAESEIRNFMTLSNGCPRKIVNWTAIAHELNKVSNCAVDQFACNSFSNIVTLPTYYLWTEQFSLVYSIADQNKIMTEGRNYALYFRPPGCPGFKSVKSITYSMAPQGNSVGITIQYGCCTGVNTQHD